MPVFCTLCGLNLRQNNKVMNKTVVISTKVINTLQSLPLDQRLNIASALAGEMLLGAGQCTDLCPDEDVVYRLLRYRVNRDSERFVQRI